MAKKFPKGTREEVLRLHSEGLLNNDIAERVGIAKYNVERFLKQAGLTYNGPGKIATRLVGDDKIICSVCGELGERVTRPRRLTVVSGQEVDVLRISGICKKCLNAQRQSWRHANVFKYRVTSIRAWAKKNNVEFGLTEELLRDQFNSQNGKCFYTDETLNPTITSKGRLREAMSVDKIVPEIGYVKGNVVLCSNRVNTVKNNLSLDEMKRWMPGWYERIDTFLRKAA